MLLRISCLHRNIFSNVISARVLLYRNMATASTIKLLPSQAANFRLPNLSQESADKVSELLQINHEKHHIFFNQSGFHVSV